MNCFQFCIHPVNNHTPNSILSSITPHPRSTSQHPYPISPLYLITSIPPHFMASILIPAPSYTIPPHDNLASYSLNADFGDLECLLKVIHHADTRWPSRYPGLALPLTLSGQGVTHLALLTALITILFRFHGPGVDSGDSGAASC